MKKTMLAILMLIISCATTNLYAASIYTKNNKFYSPKPYCYSSWYRYTWYQYKIEFRFIHTTEDNKTYLRIKRGMDNKITIGNDDYIIIVFEDGREYKLDYCTDFYYDSFSKNFGIEAMGKIDNFTNISSIQYIQNGYDYEDSIPYIPNTNNTELLKIYNNLMQEVKQVKE